MWHYPDMGNGSCEASTLVVMKLAESLNIRILTKQGPLLRGGQSGEDMVGYIQRPLIQHIQCLSTESSHQYNILVKLTKILQFQCFLTTIQIFSTYNKNLNARNLDFSTKPLWHQKQTLINMSWLNQLLYFQLFHHNLAHCLAHCLAHRLSIVRYCFRFAPLLHSCITYYFFICDTPQKILKGATDVIILSFSLLLSL
jgi:hypothetical protein